MGPRALLSLGKGAERAADGGAPLALRPFPLPRRNANLTIQENFEKAVHKKTCRTNARGDRAMPPHPPPSSGPSTFSPSPRCAPDCPRSHVTPPTLLPPPFSTPYPTRGNQEGLLTPLLCSLLRFAAEIIMFDGVVTVYKTIGDCCFYVVGDPDENELILGAVLQAFYESISMLLAMVEKKTVLENLDLVLICMDEIVDSGIVLETNSDLIASRVTMRGVEGDEANFTEQTFQQAFSQARDQLTRNLLR